MIDTVQNAIGWVELSQSAGLETYKMYHKFIFLWLAFNSIYSTISKQSDEFSQIRDFTEKREVETLHTSLLQNDEVYKNAVLYIKNRPLGGIKDLKSNEVYELNNVRHLNKVFRCLYQVRNNLFHGGKSPPNTNDQELIEICYIILSKILIPHINYNFVRKYNKNI